MAAPVRLDPFQNIVNVHWNVGIDYVAFAIVFSQVATGFTSPDWAGDPPLASIELVTPAEYDGFDFGYGSSDGWQYDDQLGQRIKAASIHHKDSGWEGVGLADIVVGNYPPAFLQSHGDWEETGAVSENCGLTLTSITPVEPQMGDVVWQYRVLPHWFARSSPLDGDGPKWIKDSPGLIVRVGFGKHIGGLRTIFDLPIHLSAMTATYAGKTYGPIAVGIDPSFPGGDNFKDARMWILCKRHSAGV